jgi:nucleotide-binding universal stress UspA family protein
MFKHILIATDGSELATKAVTAGLVLAKMCGAKVTAVTATEPWTAIISGEAGAAFPVEEYEKGAAESAARILDAVATAAKAQGVAYEGVHASGFAAEAIVETANARGCDLIAMASHGRSGLSKVLLGSQAARVLTLSAVPVLIYR